MQIGEPQTSAQVLLESIKRYDPESNAYTPDYALLTPYHTAILEFQPCVVALSLASYIEKDKLRQMLIDLSETPGLTVSVKVVVASVASFFHDTF